MTTTAQRRPPVGGDRPGAGPSRLEPHRIGLLGHREPLTIVLVACCLLLGGLAGLAPMALLAGVAAVALVALVLADLAVGLAAFTVIQFFAMVPFFGGQELTVVKATGALLAISWVIVVVRSRMRGRGEGPAVPNTLLAGYPALVVVLLLFLIWGATSYLWAVEPGLVFDDLPRYTLNFVLYGIVATAVSARRHVAWICAALVTGTLLAASSGSFFTPTNDPERLEGAIGDPNDLAAALVPGIIVALALAWTARSWRWRALAVLAACVQLYAMLLTASRGGYIGFAAGLLALLVLATRYRRVFGALIGGAGVLGVLYYLVAAPADLVARVSTAGDGSGRLDIWRLGWRVFEDRPFTGAGMGNFIVATPLYLVAPGLVTRADRILTTPKIAHNMYLSMLTELGMLGFVLFMSVVLTSLILLYRATRLFERLAFDDTALLAAALTAGLTGLLVADFFLSGQHEKHLWLLLGMGPALMLLARREAATRISPVVPRDGAPPGTADPDQPPAELDRQPPEQARRRGRARQGRDRA